LTSWIEDRPTHRHQRLRHAIQSLHKKGLLRQQVLERCPLRRKDHETIFQKQASQKSLILTRTSYLIVKEQSFLPPADFSISAINDPPSAGQCVVARRRTYSCFCDLRTPNGRLGILSPADSPVPL
jgi:hypothetical protein